MEDERGNGRGAARTNELRIVVPLTIINPSFELNEIRNASPLPNAFLLARTSMPQWPVIHALGKVDTTSMASMPMGTFFDTMLFPPSIFAIGSADVRSI